MGPANHCTGRAGGISLFTQLTVVPEINVSAVDFPVSVLRTPSPNPFRQSAVTLVISDDPAQCAVWSLNCSAVVPMRSNADAGIAADEPVFAKDQ